MPNRTIYVRNEDLDLWADQADKAGMIAWALRNYKPATHLMATPKQTEPTYEPAEEPA